MWDLRLQNILKVWFICFINDNQNRLTSDFIALEDNMHNQIGHHYVFFWTQIISSFTRLCPEYINEVKQKQKNNSISVDDDVKEWPYKHIFDLYLDKYIIQPLLWWEICTLDEIKLILLFDKNNQLNISPIHILICT